jgi:hypothetical protein
MIDSPAAGRTTLAELGLPSLELADAEPWRFDETIRRAGGVVLERLLELTLDPDAEQPRYRESFLRRWRPPNARFSTV